MRTGLVRIVILSIFLGAGATSVSGEQTIVFFRHGEKPPGGLGQLTCQGLNRAVALPSVLLAKFGAPDYLYAPNPAVKMSDPAGSFYYVRPLATIEPTAIRAGRSVNSRYGYNDITGLRNVLVTSVESQRHDLRLLGARLPRESGSEHHECIRRGRDSTCMDERRLRQFVCRPHQLREWHGRRAFRARSRGPEWSAHDLS